LCYSDSSLRHSFQILRIQPAQFPDYELSIFADQLSIEPDFTSADFWGLVHDQAKLRDCGRRRDQNPFSTGF
jgi:hypothetical protein